MNNALFGAILFSIALVVLNRRHERMKQYPEPNFIFDDKKNYDLYNVYNQYKNFRFAPMVDQDGDLRHIGIYGDLKNNLNHYKRMTGDWTKTNQLMNGAATPAELKTLNPNVSLLPCKRKPDPNIKSIYNTDPAWKVYGNPEYTAISAYKKKELYHKNWRLEKEDELFGGNIEPAPM